MKNDSGKPVTVFLCSDSSRLANNEKIMAALQACAITELKRHKNKHVPVHIIADEVTTNRIHKLSELLVILREFSARLYLYIQSLGEFRRVYGNDAVNTLFSEAVILSFLPNQRDPELLKIILNLMGNQAYVSGSNSGDFHGFNMKAQNLSEDARPVMTEDEIRRCPHTITFIRNNRPVLTDLPSYAAIDPWRHQVRPNPFYNKPYRLPIKLRLGDRKPSVLRRAWWFMTGGRA